MISVMTAAICTACDEEDDTPTTTAEKSAETTTASGEQNSPAQESDETAKILPNLPDVDWEGYTFKILTLEWEDSPEWAMWQSRDIMAEEETGDPIFVNSQK